MIKTITVNDIEMDYAVFNNGIKPFVIIPGLSLRSVMLSANMVKNRYKQGKDDYTTYLFDRRKNAPVGYTIEAMADDTAIVMKEAGIKHAYVFGASQGGMIAQCLAIKYPELVDKLVLGSTLAELNSTAEAVIGHWAYLAQCKNALELVSDIVDNIYSEKTLNKYRALLLSSYKSVTDYELKQFNVMATAANGFSVIEKLRKITCPVFVIGSKGDKVTTAAGSIEMANALNCPLYLYDETFGHGVYDEADDYPSRVLDFFGA